MKAKKRLQVSHKLYMSQKEELLNLFISAYILPSLVKAM